MRKTILVALVCSLAATTPAAAQPDSTYIRETALTECISSLDALMDDPLNRSELTPDVHRFRASLAYARELDAGADAIVPIAYSNAASPLFAFADLTATPTVEPVPPTLVEQLKELQAKYTALKGNTDKSAKMLLIAGLLAAALKLLLSGVNLLAGKKPAKWLAWIALFLAVPIALLSYYAAGNSLFDSLVYAGAGPGAIVVHELLKRLAPKKKTAEA